MKWIWALVGIFLVGGVWWWAAGPWVTVESEAGLRLKMGERGAWQEALKEVGWKKGAVLHLSDGEQVAAWQVARIRIIHTNREQEWQPQRVSQGGAVVASVGVAYSGGTLTLRIQADSDWLAQAEGQARAWRVGHQAVWMMHTMLSGTEGREAELAEIFGRLRDKNLVEIEDEG
jgi:hypothetical protein